MLEGGFNLVKSKVSHACRKNSVLKKNSRKQEVVVSVRIRPIMPKSYSASERAQLRNFERQFLVEGHSLHASVGE